MAHNKRQNEAIGWLALKAAYQRHAGYIAATAAAHTRYITAHVVPRGNAQPNAKTPFMLPPIAAGSTAASGATDAIAGSQSGFSRGPRLGRMHASDEKARVIDRHEDHNQTSEAVMLFDAERRLT
jgi:hypothetical protein